MKKLIGGLLGGLVYTAIYYGITYLYLFKLAAPGTGKLATFLTLFFLGTVAELLVVSFATGISGMIGLTIGEAIAQDDGVDKIIGIIEMIAAVLLFVILKTYGNFTLWFIVLFSGGMFLSGLKIMR